MERRHLGSHGHQSLRVNELTASLSERDARPSRSSYVATV